MKLPHTEVKFYPQAKSQTGLSSLRVSCKRAVNSRWNYSHQVFRDLSYPVVKLTESHNTIVAWFHSEHQFVKSLTKRSYVYVGTLCEGFCSISFE